jgi:hypothetical protein
MRNSLMTTECNLWLANYNFTRLSLLKMASGANAFEISNIQEVETEVVVTRQPECNNVTSRRKPLNLFFADHSDDIGAWSIRSAKQHKREAVSDHEHIFFGRAVACHGGRQRR